MQFTKIHAAGGDYLITAENFAPDRTFIRKLLDRHAVSAERGWRSFVRLETTRRKCSFISRTAPAVLPAFVPQWRRQNFCLTGAQEAVFGSF